MFYILILGQFHKMKPSSRPMVRLTSDHNEPIRAYGITELQRRIRRRDEEQLGMYKAWIF